MKEISLVNEEKASQTAKGLYPYEKWELLENGIFIARSRMPRSAEQVKILEKELQQARILAERGSTIYLLPEKAHSYEKHIKYPDAVVDNLVMEFKTITGSIRQIEQRYKEARAKTAHVFIKIDADLSFHDVRRKLAGCINRKKYAGGIIILYFTQIGELYQWSEAELASSSWLGQKKSGSQDPAAIQGKSDIPKCPR